MLCHHLFVCVKDGALVAAARVTQAGTREGLNPDHDAGNASTQREALTKLASALTTFPALINAAE